MDSTSLFDILNRKEFLDLLIQLQDREIYGKEKLHIIFDDDDLEYVEDDDCKIIEIRHKKRYKRNFGIVMRSRRAIVKHFMLFSHLYRLNLSGIYLTGKLTLLPKLSNSLTVINLSCNHLNGPIPDLSELLNLEVIDLSRNHLTGSIEHCLNHPNLRMLYLNNNLLSGELPRSFESLPNASRIVMHSNSCYGKLPDFSKNSNLGVVMLHGNYINDVVNYALPTTLKWLHLYDTNIESFHVEKLQALNLSCHVLK